MLLIFSVLLDPAYAHNATYIEHLPKKLSLIRTYYFQPSVDRININKYQFKEKYFLLI